MGTITKQNIVCPYCGAKPLLRDSVEIYGVSHGMMYVCSNYPGCDAYVGANKRSGEPLGRLANSELRKWKQKAHSTFDPLWDEKRGGKIERSEAYIYLSLVLELPREETHIGYMDVEGCKKIIKHFRNGINPILSDKANQIYRAGVKIL